MIKEIPRINFRRKAFFGGGWQHVERCYQVKSPATGELLEETSDCGTKEAQIAAEHAVTTFDWWSKTSPYYRAQVLHEWADYISRFTEELATLTSLEMGKPISEAKGEVASVVDMVKLCAEEATRIGGDLVDPMFTDRMTIVRKQPLGPVFGITPWNFPTAMVTQKVAPALAAGCTFILKPAEQTPFTALLLAELLTYAFGEVSESYPPTGGVFQVLTTNHPQEIADVLLADPRIRKFTFTGSTEVGTKLYEQASKTIKRVSLELGGHAPFIVFPDADLDQAARHLVQAKFRNTGQTCISPNRVFVHHTISQKFQEEVLLQVDGLQVGDSLNETTNVGPLVNDDALEKVCRQVEDARDKGAVVLRGGTYKGLHFQPTVLANCTSIMEIMNVETFGPVLPLCTFEEEEDVLTLANSTRYGLAAYVFTNDVKRAMRFAGNLDFGTVAINNGNPVENQNPFGGFKDSGLGREGGAWGLDGYLELKTVVLGL